MKQLPYRKRTIKEIDHLTAGIRARMMRIEAGVTQRKLAASLGLAPSYLCELEAGKKNWTEARWQAYQEALNA